MNNDTIINGRAFVEHYAQVCYYQNEEKITNLSGSPNLGSSGEDEFRVNDIDGNIRHGPGMEVLSQDDHKIQRQQTPGSLVNWERFLPLKSVKVLLVESDASTRHVVSALLRNCSYEVTAVAHGLQAWKTLQDVSSRIDIILTEVVMPLLSGMDLLCKIMGHKTLKNIPVIMMSSHDSMGIVFKCLSKGAVDFLAKPIRKNELKNLWQHVWRRSYSLSGSGSESGTQAEQVANLRVTNYSESNTSTCNEHGNGRNELSIQKCSGDVSGTETSWTKKVSEIKNAPPCDQRPNSDDPDITCAEMIYARPEKHHKRDEQSGTVAMCKDVISEKLSACKGMKVEYALFETDCKPKENGQQDQEHDTCGKLRSEGFNVGGGAGAANCSIPQPQSRDPNGMGGTKRKFDQGEVQYVEPTLKRLHGMPDDGKSAKDDHNILRHSNLSAFSKYSTVASVNQGPSGNKGSSPLDNGSDAIRSGGGLSALQSNCSTKNNQLGLKSSESSAFQPIQKEYQKASSKETESPSKAFHQKAQVQHHHHHHHHHHYHHHHQQPPDLNENRSDTAAASLPCRSLNLAIEENAGNISGGGSNQGSEGNNNGSNNIPSGGDYTENGSAKTSGSGGGFSGTATEEDRVAMREAALTKFRQKRKERCFDKRVRYQSRKKLAEQRPRMKGQFVKQIKSEAKRHEG